MSCAIYVELTVYYYVTSSIVECKHNYRTAVIVQSELIKFLMSSIDSCKLDNKTLQINQFYFKSQSHALSIWTKYSHCIYMFNNLYVRVCIF